MLNKIKFDELLEFKLTDKKSIVVSNLNNEKIVIGQKTRYQDKNDTSRFVDIFQKNAIILSHQQFEDFKEKLANI